MNVYEACAGSLLLRVDVVVVVVVVDDDDFDLVCWQGWCVVLAVTVNIY